MYTVACFFCILIQELFEKKVDEDEEPKPWAEQIEKFEKIRRLSPLKGKHPPRKVGYELPNSRKYYYVPPGTETLCLEETY